MYDQLGYTNLHQGGVLSALLFIVNVNADALHHITVTLTC